MSFKDSKVAIVGCGSVGATTAYTIISQGLCESLVLIDVNKDKAYAEALDMENAVFFMNRNISVKAGSYDDCKDADIVIITASAPMPKDSHDRLAMLQPSMNIMRSIVEGVMASGFDGIFVVVSNPVDIMTYYVWKLSGLPMSRVIGSGTALDTARLCCELSGLYELDAKSVETFIAGEHGDSEVVLWNTGTIGGKPIVDVMNDNDDRTKGLTRADLEQSVKEMGWEIFNRKGNTCYGIAAATTAIVKSILFNENRILPVSAGLQGQYGLDSLFLSVPVILSKEGTREIVEINLSQEEKDKLDRSAEIIQSFYKDLNI